MATTSRRQRLLAEEDGLTLAEVLVAITILTVAILGVAVTAATSMTTLRVSRERQQATAAASAAIERARSHDYRQMAHLPGQVTSADPNVTGSGPYYFDHDGAGPAAAEPVVTANDGKVTPYAYTAHGGRLAVRVYVTWYDDPDTTATTQDARRVTAVVTWKDPNTARKELRESTIVAEADRGLPVPQFEIRPDDLTQYAKVGGRTCFSHLLRNIGASDSYDWQLYKHNGYPGSPATVVNAYTFRANGWEAQAWFGQPDYLIDGSPNALSPNLFKETTGDGRPDSPRPVLTTDNEVLTVCYTSKNSSADNHSTPSMVVEVRSAFDANVKQTVANRIDTTKASHQLYLHDIDNSASHDRTLGVAYPMDTVVPTQTDASGNLIDVLYDYDTNEDPSDLPGTYLKKGSSTHTLAWTYNGFSAGMKLASGRIIFYSAWKDAFSGSSTAPNLTYQMALDVVSGTGVVLQTVYLSPSSHSYTHSSAGWVKLDIPFTFVDAFGNPANLEFLTGEEHLRLRLACTGGSQSEDCHVAYDTNSYRSTLIVSEP